MADETIPLDTAVAEEAVRIRKSPGLKLPDAIIYASAWSREAMLVTRNTKDFDLETVDVRCPYTF